jgi:hypothetical protein
MSACRRRRCFRSARNTTLRLPSPQPQEEEEEEEEVVCKQRRQARNRWY